MPEVTVRVILYPNDQVRDRPPHPEWPAGTELRLVLVAGRNHYELETKQDGTAHKDTVAAGRYTIKLPDLAGFQAVLWPEGATEPADKLVVNSAPARCVVGVLPPAGHALLPLRVYWLAPGATEVIPLPDVTVEVTPVASGTPTPFTSRSDGTILAHCPPGTVRIDPPERLTGQPALKGVAEVPDNAVVHTRLSSFVVGTPEVTDFGAVPVEYTTVAPEAGQIVITPRLDSAPGTASGSVELTGVTFELLAWDATEPVRRSAPPGETTCTFTDVPPGQVTVRVVDVPDQGGLRVRVDPARSTVSAVLRPGGRLDMSGYFGFTAASAVPAHAIEGHVRYADGSPVTATTVEVRDARGTLVGHPVTDETGWYRCAVDAAGEYWLAAPGAASARAEVHSTTTVDLTVRNGRGGGGGGNGNGAESVVDLAAYPVLTEEVSLAGGGVLTAPGGARPSTAPGAGYGQDVDQVLRDVLGWRPTDDPAAFQAALSGAFTLREDSGHTAWSWQQRGYAVQADLGALSGAQASIHARAQAALDQIRPLLTGLTPLDPGADPQDTGAIRTIIQSELDELVAELAIEGGPRVQRIDELFGLLLGIGAGSTAPDTIGGQLGVLRDRFGLTEERVGTLDEERVVTNFRVLADHVRTLQTSWNNDKALLSVDDPRSSLGTVLIRLSRAMDVVGETVDELIFAFNSVFLDAAQRGVTYLRFASMHIALPDLPLSKGTCTDYPFGPQEPPLLLSDLLDWVVRASTQEGPRLVQDAGKDGVIAFAPVLDRLRILLHATADLACQHQSSLPAGLRTPRVRRSLAELATQLDQAASLASVIHRIQPPRITAVSVNVAEASGTTPHAAGRHELQLVVYGEDFPAGVTAELAADRTGPNPLQPLAGGVNLIGPSQLTVNFDDPNDELDNTGSTWSVTLIGTDGVRSNSVRVRTCNRGDG